jgi:hypothetical protein
MDATNTPVQGVTYKACNKRDVRRQRSRWNLNEVGTGYCLVFGGKNKGKGKASYPCNRP